ncbi:ABC transporter substrate-binding protein [Paenibacillus swuensis]|uniref:ABC transporter substrate-binding protein n=2 Tax=Paenibacillus swuensis TaxID=1178515 RepID=A0A172TQ00_9BACL|nr:ABC transporter substrate-binding protein [Paenibacillus swuensis]
MRSRPVYMLIAAVLFIVVLSACGTSGAEKERQAAEGKVRIITSFFPLADFARNIGGERVYVSNLVPSGVEPHDWSPKSRDMENIAEGQLFLYNGAGFEGWVDDFLSTMPKDSKLITVEASKGISLISAEEEEHADEHAEEGNTHSDSAGNVNHNSEHEHDLSTDPHTWSSPASALIMGENIKNALVKADPAHQGEYEENWASYKEKLTSLHEQFKTKLAATVKKDIVVSHHAFGYLCRDYGLRQVSIMGLSPDAEPRGQDLLEIAKFVKEHKVKYIFFEELVSDQLARTLASEADADTLVLNPVEGLTEEQEQSGEDYISIMEVNLQNLLKALQ